MADIRCINEGAEANMMVNGIMEVYLGMDEMEPTIPNLIHSDLAILSNILFFLRYDELISIYEKFVIYMKRMRVILKTNKNFYCPIFDCIQEQLQKTKLTFILEDHGTVTPVQLYKHVNDWMNIGNLVYLDLTSLFDVKYFGCPNANFVYDFRAAVGLTHLSISGAMIQNVKVRTHNLIFLKLMGIPNSYNDRFRGEIEFEPTGVRHLFRNVPKLRQLVIDYIPHFGLFKLSDYLECITIECYDIDTHTLTDFFELHRLSLRRMRIFENGKYIRNFFESLMMKGIVFPNVINLVFKTRDFLYSNKYECSNLPIVPWMFPRLKYLTFGVEMRENNGKSELRETAEIIRHYGAIGISRVVLRKDGDVTVNDEFNVMLNWLKSYDGPNYTFVPIDVMNDYDDRVKF